MYIYLLISYFCIFCFVAWIIHYCLVVLQIPSRILQENGVPKESFWCFRYSFLPRGTLIPMYICLYDNYTLLQSYKEHFIIDKENFIEFKDATLFKPSIIKFKTNDIYKYKTIYFAYLTKNNAEKIRKYMNNYLHVGSYVGWEK